MNKEREKPTRYTGFCLNTYNGHPGISLSFKQHSVYTLHNIANITIYFCKNKRYAMSISLDFYCYIARSMLGLMRKRFAFNMIMVNWNNASFLWWFTCLSCLARFIVFRFLVAKINTLRSERFGWTLRKHLKLRAHK